MKPAAGIGTGVVAVGNITGAHGVRGWVKIRSDTEPREQILQYQPWLVGQGLRPMKVERFLEQGKRLLVQLEGIQSRESAEEIKGAVIAVRREQFPDPGARTYYWADLIGLKVRTLAGTDLGRIREMLATGAHDVMVVEGDRERLIPFVMDRYVKRVDRQAGQVEVDWNADF